MYSLFIGVTLLGLAGASPTPSLGDLKIVGGESIDITEAPYQVSLVYRGRHSCGGTLVTSDLVVTAAHCISNSNPLNYQVRAGSSNHQDGGELYPVGELVWHPGFGYFNMDSDIALVWLSKPVTFTKQVAAIDMLDDGEEIEEGAQTIVTGWGHLNEGGGMLSSTLQMVKVPVVDEKICRDAYSSLYNITSRMLCAGVPEGGKDACQGDSGGPLVYNGKLAGVVSWGLGCARPDYPGVYAKVSALRPWIDEKIAYLRLKHVLRMI